MDRSLTFRPLRRADYAAAAQIVRETWHYDEFCAPAAAKAMARLYLASALAEHSFSCGAFQNGVLTGFILARARRARGHGLRFLPMQAGALLRLAARREGRTVLRLFGGFASLDRDLLDARAVEYDGTLCLFAVRAQARGTGLGGALYRRAMDYFAAAGVQRFYLYTDTSCSYGFYEHQGLRRAGTRDEVFRLRGEVPMQFFLYEGGSGV